MRTMQWCSAAATWSHITHDFFCMMPILQSNHSVIMYNNTMVSFNMMEAARVAGIKR